MAPRFAGIWRVESAEDLELLYEAMGLDDAVIDRVLEDHPTIEIRQHGDYFYIKNVTKVTGIIEASFKVGEIYELPTISGKKVRNKTDWVGGGKKLQIRPIGGKKEDPASVYELDGDKMIVTLYALGVSARRTFVKVPDS
ncbi:cellular retinoic acid-binding protein 1-like [Ptychodera flava]|uniref:cellular retinoic acid-binding protein 1-like n=1 Tax=Ptychodera flava TaxID=63121 RepID=UPI00396A3409